MPQPEFRVAVAASPTASTSLVSEVELLKAAVLYGDKATVLSPVASMYQRIEAMSGFSPTERVQLLRHAAPSIVEPEDLNEFEANLTQIDELLRLKRSNSRSEILARHMVVGRLNESWEAVSAVVSELIDGSGYESLRRARSAGLVEIELLDAGDSYSMLADSLAVNRARATGTAIDPEGSGVIVDAFVDRLSVHLAEGREYLLFDDATASLTRSAISEGVFTPAPGPAGRAAQAMTASSLLGDVPTVVDFGGGHDRQAAAVTGSV
jgi:hypothetical protein